MVIGIGSTWDRGGVSFLDKGSALVRLRGSSLAGEGRSTLVNGESSAWDKEILVTGAGSTLVTGAGSTLARRERSTGDKGAGSTLVKGSGST